MTSTLTCLYLLLVKGNVAVELSGIHWLTLGLNESGVASHKMA